jgi:hypothetical protein
MDLAALLNPGWRAALIVLIALLALYVVFVLWRMRRLRPPAAPAAGGAAEALAAYAAVQAPAQAAAATETSGDPSPPPASAPTEPGFAWNEPPAPLPEEARLAGLERDAAQVRRELAALRAEVRVLDESLGALREETLRELAQARSQAQTQARVVQNASPIYSDAMQMAMQGHSAADISEHCGIARAEAELVVALVRNRDQDNPRD